MLKKNQGINNTQWPACTCCGQAIRLLWDQQAMMDFFNHHTARRRAYQCKNCGQITCFTCSHSGRYCQCHSNAWVALPYLEDRDDAMQTRRAPTSNTQPG